MSDEISNSVSTRWPKSVEANGLVPHLEDVRYFPRKVRAAVILFDCPSTLVDNVTDKARVTLRIKRVEVVTDVTDRSIIEAILLREYERRSAEEMSDELVADIAKAFHNEDDLLDEKIAEEAGDG